MHPNNHVEVFGGLKSQRKIVEQVVEHCVDQLIPRVRTLWVEVTLDRLEEKENVVGYCSHLEHNYYWLEIDKDQPIYGLILTTCHEMVHVKQGVRKELTHNKSGQKQLWKGLETGRKEPWEREAWELQPKLAHSFIKNTLKTSIKSIKSLDKRF
jgi:hypothetical protein|tara:strand:- start:700 stop:1161 length:462 start_codon:yes stop_codon:yes gene_type:complete